MLHRTSSSLASATGSSSTESVFLTPSHQPLCRKEQWTRILSTRPGRETVATGHVFGLSARPSIYSTARRILDDLSLTRAMIRYTDVSGGLGPCERVK